MKINGILETSLYADDLDEALTFYREIIGLELVQKSEKRHLFFRCGSGMLLIFNARTTRCIESIVDGKTVPFHGTEGAGHVAFSVLPGDLAGWRQKLKDRRIEIESEIEWPTGGRSVYFRDPAGNSLEITTPSIWESSAQ